MKIDGAVALIMGVARAMGDEDSSVADWVEDLAQQGTALQVLRARNLADHAQRSPAALGGLGL